VIASLVIALLAQTPQLSGAGKQVDLTTSAGLSAFLGDFTPAFSLDPGALLEVTAHVPLASHFAIGFAVNAGSGTLRPEGPPPLAFVERSYWLASGAASAEARWSVLSGHVCPFVGARLGWAARDFGGDVLTHGPLAGVTLGLDVRPWPQFGLHIGGAATSALALGSNANWPHEVRGYVLRGTGRWGDTFKLTAWASFALRLGYTF
jgi:hypothetical protein